MGRQALEIWRGTGDRRITVKIRADTEDYAQGVDERLAIVTGSSAKIPVALFVFFSLPHRFGLRGNLT